MCVEWARRWGREDNQEVGLEAAILERVRNSSLVEHPCADNVPGLNTPPKRRMSWILDGRGSSFDWAAVTPECTRNSKLENHKSRRGRGASRLQGSVSVSRRGAGASANVGMSNASWGENPHRRTSEASAARTLRSGSVGPKPRPQGVGDGQQVDIPAPLEVALQPSRDAGRDGERPDEGRSSW